MTQAKRYKIHGRQAWRDLAKQVIAEERICWLRFPGICTIVATSADHIIPVSRRPDLALVRANVRAACRPCNTHRGNASLTRVKQMRHKPNKTTARQPNNNPPKALRYFNTTRHENTTDTTRFNT